jgi:predicted GIY-YIG superfamily endonuclease
MRVAKCKGCRRYQLATDILEFGSCKRCARKPVVPAKPKSTPRRKLKAIPKRHMRLYYVYAITCAVNKKLYIGVTVNVGERIKLHFQALRRGNHHNKALQEDFLKYGENAFVSYTIRTDESIDPLNLERFHIKLYAQSHSLYNVLSKYSI